MATYKPLVNAEGKKGVRYREHRTRKHGAVPDRYYVLVYWWNGKTVSEAVGWASDGWTPTQCFELLTKIKYNQGIKEGPCTLGELRADAEAEKAAKKRETAAQERQNVSFKKFFDDVFITDAKTRWTPETARRSEQHVETWINPVTGDMPMREIGLTEINKIKNRLSLKKRSARTMQYVFRTFSMTWSAALDHGIVTTPCPTAFQSFRLPKVDNEKQRYLTLDEEKILLEKVKVKNQQAHDMAVIAFDAGLRFGEIASLAWGCVDIEDGFLRVLDTKGKTDRNVPMTERIKSLFKSMTAGKPSQLVFPNGEGNIQKQVPSAFKRGLVDAKMNEGVENKKMRASFHTLRHTYASRLVQAGVDLYRVQRLLGHSTPVMTARYGKLADGDLKEAVKTMERDKIVKKSKGKVLPLQKRKAKK